LADQYCVLAACADPVARMIDVKARVMVRRRGFIGRSRGRFSVFSEEVAEAD